MELHIGDSVMIPIQYPGFSVEGFGIITTEPKERWNPFRNQYESYVMILSDHFKEEIEYPIWKIRKI